MKAIVTIDGNIPSYYAHSFNVMKMAQGFADNGLDVELLTLLSFPGIKNYLKIKNVRKFYGVRNNFDIKMLPVYNRDFFTKSIRAKGYFEKAKKYILKKNPEFVFSRGFTTFYNSVTYGIPAIVETHRTDYDHPFLKMLYEVADHSKFLGMVTIHESIKQEHIKRGIPENKVLVLEDGVDLEQYRISKNSEELRRSLNLPANKKILLYSGGLYREKGIDLILRMAKAFEQRDDLLFVLIGGKKGELKYWKGLAEDTYKINNVIFKGFQPNHRVPKFLRAADILLMPYDISISYKVMDINSTSPLKLFEYMASETPIVSTDIPVISKVAQHGKHALLADPKNFDSLIYQVEELLNKKELGEKLAKEAVNEVKKYQWKERCQLIIERLVTPNL